MEIDSLLGTSIAPISYSIGFLEYDYASTVEDYLKWQSAIQARRGVSLDRTEVSGELRDVLKCLLPLTSVERRRFLFIPTRSNWTAYLDNGHQSTDAMAPMSYLARTLKCRAVRATAVPDSPIQGRFPARVLEIYGPEPTQFLNHIRGIGVVCDDTKWTFSSTGTVQTFEKPDRYIARSVKDRFTTEMLRDYLGALGIDAFNADFYCTSRTCTATLIEKRGPIAPKMKEFQLPDLVGVA